mmetsp:Transcript_1529/g.1050  ORF Transcript_1529/g.1050 Transcript_1529/m.1050 type:complete len:144 (-) Transcript_1529:1472-1903(-)
MICFDLKCENNHLFEGWFENNDSFKKQHRQGLLSCPICNNTTISKTPSTFGIKKSSQTSIKKSASLNKIDIENFKKEFNVFLEKNFDDVGCNFAKEALKIHYGLSDPRNIKGVSTKEEEEILEKEGVKFLKLPYLSMDSDYDA